MGSPRSLLRGEKDEQRNERASEYTRKRVICSLRGRGQGVSESLGPGVPRPTPPLRAENRKIEDGGLNTYTY